MTAPIHSSWVGPAKAATTTATNDTATETVAESATSPDTSAPAPAPATTSTGAGAQRQQQQHQHPKQPFYALVVDSGVIVKSSGEIISKLRGVARRYVCPPGVVEEIRDSRSRQALQQARTLLDLTPTHPTPSSVETIIEFSKQTGDFPSLSTVDIHVLALTLDMEREGCIAAAAAAAAAAANASDTATATATGAVTTPQSATLLQHIRATPKRTLGLGKITQLNNTTTTTATKRESSSTTSAGDNEGTSNSSPPTSGNVDSGNVFENNETSINSVSPDAGAAGMFILDDDDFDVDEDDDESDNEEECIEDNVEATQPETPPTDPSTNPSSFTNAAPPKSWAALVNPNVAAGAGSAATAPDATVLASTSPTTATDAASGTRIGGQFDDADADEDEKEEENGQDEKNVDSELENEFPSLAAASTVNFAEHDSDDNKQEDNSEKKKDSDANENFFVEKDINGDGDNTNLDQSHDDPASHGGLFERTEEEKKRALQPVSKSGRLYNTLGKYKKLAQPPKQLNKNPSKQSQVDDKDEPEEKKAVVESSASIQNPNDQKTKILTSISLAENMEENDDDGEGWISSVSGIRSSSMNFGSGAGTKFANNDEEGNKPQQQSQSTNSTQPPPRSCRSACTTTDFAMQNVLLQMNLFLWSAVDGMEIKRLKTWVIRCGVCYKVHPADDQFEGRIKRMFCSHCGSGDMMQRVSASVDGKTGRLKLHFSRKSAVRQKHANARGTKFSLPKAGTHNRFQGDLLLREDQLLMGAWNQKMKIKTGRKQSLAKAESMFGKDLSTSVGGAPNAYSPDDIRVGFGAPRRHNPNSAKGRERRGKKKKTSDRACGMRRY